MFTQLLTLFYILKYGKNNVYDLEYDTETKTYIIAVASENMGRIQRDINNELAFIFNNKLFYKNRPYNGYYTHTN